MAAIIRTVTLNPALDEALSIAHLELGGTNRCSLDSLDPGGKGINASRVIHRLGRLTLALGAAGGVTGEFLRARLDAEGVPHDLEPVDGFTRVNVMLYESKDARRTRLYLPGPAITSETLDAIEKRLLQCAAGDIVILGGSLPADVDAGVYGRWIAELNERGARCIVDTSGEALRAALKARPLLVKPNLEEAEELLGRSLQSDRDVIDALQTIRGMGARYAVISRGERGAFAATGDELWQALPPSVYRGSAVGAGDSMTAGLAIGLNESSSFAEALRLGMAAGAATAMVFGTQLCNPETVEELAARIVVEPLSASPATRSSPATKRVIGGSHVVESGPRIPI